MPRAITISCYQQSIISLRWLDDALLAFIVDAFDITLFHYSMLRYYLAAIFDYDYQA